jgi:uncharacterized protein YbjT (DUF2867 family)
MRLPAPISQLRGAMGRARAHAPRSGGALRLASIGMSSTPEPPAEPPVKPTGPVLVIGGSRGTGLLITRVLARRGVPVRVLARNPAAAAERLGSGIEIVEGDITDPGTLGPVLRGVGHVVFTAGVRSGRATTRSKIRTTEYEGVVNTLEAVRRAGVTGRFLYMTASGVGRPSFWSIALNIYKGNTLVWRRRAETAIRESGLPYTIIRAGVLWNRPPGTHAIQVTQRELPLSPWYRIARADVAEVFAAALDHPRTVRATFEVIWNGPPRGERLTDLMNALVPDEAFGSRGQSR